MAKTLVTGGTGFLGSHLVRALAERGDELRLLVRRGRELAFLERVEFERAEGDVRDRDSVRRAMEGIERVFHVAGSTSMRRGDRDRVFAVNVEGTRNVMEEALKAGVARAVHTSSVSAIGPAEPGGTADESQLFPPRGIGVGYVDSKHAAEDAALSVGARGLPLVIVNPSFVFGPDDPNPSGTSNALIRRLLLRRVFAYVDGGLNVVDVRDVALGHLLADERGHEGERYILGGRNFTLHRLFVDIARIAGVPAPPVRVPGRAALAGVGLLEVSRIPQPLPTSSDEVRSGMLWWTYRNDKARVQLGFAPRPHEETLEDTVRWELDQLGERFEGHHLTDAAMRLTGVATRIPSRLLPFGRG